MNNNPYERFGKILVKNVLSRLTGVHEDFYRRPFNSLPSRELIIGGLGGTPEDIDDTDEHYQSLNSLSVKFLLNELEDDIDINISFFIYYRVYPTFSEQKKYLDEFSKNNFAYIWKKEEINDIKLSLNNFDEDSINQKIKGKIQKIILNSETLKKDVHNVNDHLSSESTYASFLENQKESN